MKEHVLNLEEQALNLGEQVLNREEQVLNLEEQVLNLEGQVLTDIKKELLQSDGTDELNTQVPSTDVLSTTTADSTTMTALLQKIDMLTTEVQQLKGRRDGDDNCKKCNARSP